MKVKIGDKIYDSTIEPIAVSLSEQDKATINGMKEGQNLFCNYPIEGHTPEEIKRWLEE